ncbi:MAG: ATPase domain-containing protein, partial [Burkholderiales bacterium]
MKKAKSAYVCSDCGATALQWFGTCPSCGLAGTLVETLAERGSVKRLAGSAPGAVALDQVETRELERLSTGIGELDRVLGGGLVAGQVVLIGGDPGIGKSTLLLQALASLGSAHNVLYVSGEESAEQVAMRARRLALDARAVHLIAEIQLERIAATLDARRPEVAVMDSIQTLWSEALQSAPGSVAQVRECAAQLARHAKKSGTALFIIGHVTKDGA